MKYRIKHTRFNFDGGFSKWRIEKKYKNWVTLVDGFSTRKAAEIYLKSL